MLGTVSPWESDQPFCLLTQLEHCLGVQEPGGHFSPDTALGLFQAVLSAVVHQGELTGSAFGTGSGLLLAACPSGAFFVQWSDEIFMKSAAGLCKKQW